MPTARFANATRQELSQRLGRDESTVYRWLKRYKQGGIDALLEVKTAPGKSGLIPDTVMSQLHERLAQPQGFRSYSQIHSLAHSRVPGCSCVQNRTRSLCAQDNAKLKVPRPRSAKAKPEVQDAFKKNFQQIFQVLLRYLGTDKQVRLRCQDESRLGLKTLTGRTITLKGVKPVGIGTLATEKLLPVWCGRTSNWR